VASQDHPTPTPADKPELSRLEKLHRIEQLGIDPWGGRFDGPMPIGQIRQLPAKPLSEADLPLVRAAGRIVGRRDQGKLYFLDLWDQTGKIQVLLGQKQIGELGWKLAELLDLGDLIGIDGHFGTTRRGELSIQASSLTILAKSLEPHPTGYYGMEDVEFRLRHRYLDLIYTPQTLQRAHQRIKIVRTIRNYLDERGFVEAETPTLHAIAGGAAARPFTTHHNALGIDLFLRIALELHLKRLLVGGIERVYEIGRVFRNEGISPRHNPEFTMLELYQAYGDYRTMMDLTEGIIVACADALGGGRHLQWGDREVNLEPPFQRASYAELFERHVGIRMDQTDQLAATAQARGINPAGKHPDVLIHELFEACVEEALVGPIFVYDYPASLCPLTRRKRDNPALAERFELYIHGLELANAYTELNDPITQEATFRSQLAGLPEEESMAKMDEDFVRALRHGMPPAGGLGIGIDRLTMLLTNTQSIRDVILFPLCVPESIDENRHLAARRVWAGRVRDNQSDASEQPAAGASERRCRFSGGCSYNI
jgi:lysyl-tRNA synthetase class 2